MPQLNNDKNGDLNLSSRATDAIRKLLASGISSVLTTEDGIRNSVGDLKLPKEALQFLLTQTDNGRREVVRVVSEEFKEIVRGMDLKGELRKALVGLTLEVNASIKIKDDAENHQLQGAAEVAPIEKQASVAKKPKRKTRVRKSAPKATIETK